MSVSKPSQIPSKRPIPVPHGVSVPPKRDDRWKYVLAIALALVLLLLLLLLGTLSTGTGTRGAGSQSGESRQSGASQAGLGQEGESTDPEGGEEATDAKSADSGLPDAESDESVGNSVDGTDEETTLPVADTEAEPSRETALEDLLRRLRAEPGDDVDFQPDDRRERNQSGGDTLVKGDASVNFFGASGKGSKFVFVFDRSSSMTGRPLESVKRELIKSLEPLKSNHSFNIIAYDSTYDMWKPRLISATTENKADSVRFVERIGARGGTEPREPLLAAIDQKPEIIFFMTDGEFSLNVDEICWKGKGIIINVVQFSDSMPLVVLQELARRTGGEFMLIKASGLSDAL